MFAYIYVMSAWLLSIAGVVVIGVLVELLLTDSPMSKFIRSIYAFFILLVIVSPLPGFFRGGMEVGGAGRFEYDWALIGHINSQSSQASQHRVQTALDSAGFTGVIVTVTPDKNSPRFVIDRVHINAWHHRDNINAQRDIIRIVTLTLNIDEGRIVFNA